MASWKRRQRKANAGRKVGIHIGRVVLWIRLSLRGAFLSLPLKILHRFCHRNSVLVNSTTSMSLLCGTGPRCGRSINDLEVDSELLLQGRFVSTRNTRFVRLAGTSSNVNSLYTKQGTGTRKPLRTNITIEILDRP